MGVDKLLAKILSKNDGNKAKISFELFDSLFNLCEFIMMILG